jgi:hypothetical protein
MEVYKALDDDVFDKVDSDWIQSRLPPGDAIVFLNGIDNGTDCHMIDNSKTYIIIHISHGELMETEKDLLNQKILERIQAYLEKFPG